MLTGEKQLNNNHSTVQVVLQHNRSGYMLGTHIISKVTCNIIHECKLMFKNAQTNVGKRHEKKQH